MDLALDRRPTGRGSRFLLQYQRLARPLASIAHGAPERAARGPDGAPGASRMAHRGPDPAGPDGASPGPDGMRPDPVTGPGTRHAIGGTRPGWRGPGRQRRIRHRGRARGPRPTQRRHRAHGRADPGPRGTQRGPRGTQRGARPTGRIGRGRGQRARCAGP
jgi:hypothetical protein